LCDQRAEPFDVVGVTDQILGLGIQDFTIGGCDGCRDGGKEREAEQGGDASGNIESPAPGDRLVIAL